jgi:hypothetical protein
MVRFASHVGARAIWPAHGFMRIAGVRGTPHRALNDTDNLY